MMILKKGIILVLQLYLSSFCGGILSGNDEQTIQITDIPAFGCHWQGGSVPGVICICRTDEEWTIDRNIPAFDTTFIEIRDCRKITFKENSIANMRNLRNLHLENIAELELEEKSLNWFGYKALAFQEPIDLSIPSLKIQIINCNVSKISSQTFSGRINEIVLDGVNIVETNSFAFSNLLQTENIAVKNSILQNIRIQAFKKFETENLELTNVTANIIPSRMFSDVIVNKLFTVSNCNFTTVRSSAFGINNPNYVTITKTYIGELDGEGFKIQNTENVVFKDNVFYKVNDGAFHGIQSKKNLFLTFDSNTFSEITRESLTFPESTLKINNLNLNTTCDCQQIDHMLKNPEHFSEMRCLYETNFITIEDYKADFCSVLAGRTNIIIIVSVVGSLLIIIAFVLAMFLKKHLRSSKYGNQKQLKNGQLSLIVPDGRTYRETELHVIVEKTDLLTTDL